jgi:hypothetical protein
MKPVLLVFGLLLITLCACEDMASPNIADSDASGNAPINDVSNSENFMAANFGKEVNSFDSLLSHLFAGTDSLKNWSEHRGNNGSTSQLNKTVLAFLNASKNTLIRQFDETVNASKKQTVPIVSNRIEMEKQFAENFINGILQIVRNPSSMISDGDIRKINATGEAFVNLLFTIAKTEKSIGGDNKEMNETEIFRQLFGNQEALYSILIETKSRFESQNNIQLSSSSLFSTR